MALPLATLTRTLLGRKGTGYFPSPTDERDGLHAWASPLGVGAKIFGAVDDLVPHIMLRDQLGTNSCTQHAIDYGLQALCGSGEHAGHRIYTLRSVASPYWHGRALNHLEGRDQGAVFRSVLKANQQLGAPPESAWPLRARTINQQPGAETYRLGRRWRGLEYARVEGDLIKGALEALSAGLPVVAGFEVDEAFMQNAGPTEVLALAAGGPGHALMLAGFTRVPGRADSVRFRSPGSWGSDWRDGGWCALGPDVVAGALEMWVLTGWSK